MHLPAKTRIWLIVLLSVPLSFGMGFWFARGETLKVRLFATACTLFTCWFVSLTGLIFGRYVHRS